MQDAGPRDRRAPERSIERARATPGSRSARTSTAANLDDADAVPGLRGRGGDLGAAVFVHPWDMFGEGADGEVLAAVARGHAGRDRARRSASLIFAGVFERLPKPALRVRARRRVVPHARSARIAARPRRASGPLRGGQPEVSPRTSISATSTSTRWSTTRACCATSSSLLVELEPRDARERTILSLSASTEPGGLIGSKLEGFDEPTARADAIGHRARVPRARSRRRSSFDAPERSPTRGRSTPPTRSPSYAPSASTVPERDGKPVVYLCGNSLGLHAADDGARSSSEELDDWRRPRGLRTRTSTREAPVVRRTTSSSREPRARRVVGAEPRMRWS